MSVSQMSSEILSEISAKMSSSRVVFTVDCNTQVTNLCEPPTAELFIPAYANKNTESCEPHEPHTSDAVQTFETYKYAENVHEKTVVALNPAINLTQADDVSSENGYNTILATVSALGSVVRMYKEQSNDSYRVVFQSVGGQNLCFSFIDDTSIMENKDGSTSVYFSETNTTRVYDALGNSRDFEGNTLGKKGDTILINITAKSVRLGDGNNTIINFAHGSSIEAGDGNNLVFSHISEQNIRLGNGDNCMRITETQSSSAFSLGNGNNKITILGLDASKLSVGNGNNSADVQEVKNGSEIILGNGNNVLELHEISASSSLTLGDGVNKTSLYRLRSASSLLTGNGNTIIKISEVSDSSKVNMGDGHNIFSTQNISHNSELVFGNGNNTLIMCDMIKALLRLGNGHNNVSLYDVESSKIFFGEGNNTLDIFELEMSSLIGGDGNNQANIQEAKISKIHLGDGTNNLHAMRFENSSAYTGNGNNFIQIFITNRASSLEMGDGDNACVIDYLFDESKLSLGNGNNDLYVHEIQEGAYLSLGSGDNSLQIHTVVDIESISTGSGNNLGVIAHHAHSESVYLVGNIFYAQVQLETLAHDSNQESISIANEINERRKLRKEKNLVIASESAQDFNPHMTANAFIQQNQTWQSQKDAMAQKFLVQGKKDAIKNNVFFADNRLDTVAQASYSSQENLYTKL